MAFRKTMMMMMIMMEFPITWTLTMMEMEWMFDQVQLGQLARVWGN